MKRPASSDESSVPRPGNWCSSAFSAIRAAVLPMATFNSAVLGVMLLTATQGFSWVQTMGFALGSGVGYMMAVVIVTEGQRKLRSRSVPAAFKGLPVTLLYIGILSLAIYGFTGHRPSI